MNAIPDGFQLVAELHPANGADGPEGCEARVREVGAKVVGDLEGLRGELSGGAKDEAERPFSPRNLQGG